MNIKVYYDKINARCQEIFQDTISDTTSFGNVHHLSACVFEFSECLIDPSDRNLLRVVSSQIESSALSLALGFYRQAFSSLRLALELGLGSVYFSIFKLEHQEWLEGKGDIKWRKIIDIENGAISKRLTNAFFHELIDHYEGFNEKSSCLYRDLSEFVHGNYETWEQSGLVLSKNSELIEKYFLFIKNLKEVLFFALACRYLKFLPSDKLESLQFICEDLYHIEPIRLLVGGPKEK